MAQGGGRVQLIPSSDPCKGGHITERWVRLARDRQPDGMSFPRCVACGHRRTNALGTQPTSTRVIVIRQLHPWYVITELRGRRMARAYG